MVQDPVNFCNCDDMDGIGKESGTYVLKEKVGIQSMNERGLKPLYMRAIHVSIGVI